MPGTPASHYGEARGHKCADTPIHRAVFVDLAHWAEAKGHLLPRADGRLCAVATALVGLMLDGRPPPQPAVDFALSQAGVIEPAPQFLVVTGTAGRTDEVSRELIARLEQLPACSVQPRIGLGTARRPDGSIVVGLLWQESFISLEPVQRVLPQGGVAVVRGQVLLPFRDPVVFVTDVAGKTRRVPPARAGSRSFQSRVECVDPGRAQIEVLATAKEGPVVLANFPIWCGNRPPSVLALAPERPGSESPEQAERHLFDLINRDRARYGLAPLLWHAGAADVARAHSRAMRESGRVAHVLPQSGNVAERVKKAGIHSPTTLENLARAYTSTDAHLGLMNSPGHRANIMSDEVTDVGIGVVLDGGGQAPALYVTEVFVREVAAHDLVRERELLRHRIAKRRTFKDDRGLDRVAQRVAEELAKRQGELSERRRQVLLQEAPRTYRRVGAVVGVLADAQQMQLDDLPNDADGLGVGVAEGTYPALGDKALYVVVLLGHRG